MRRVLCLWLISAFAMAFPGAAETALSLTGADFMISACYIYPWNFDGDPEIAWTLEAYGVNGCSARLEADGAGGIEWRLTRKGLSYLNESDIDALTLAVSDREWAIETEDFALDGAGEGEWSLVVRFDARGVEARTYYPETCGEIRPGIYYRERGETYETAACGRKGKHRGGHELRAGAEFLRRGYRI